MHLTVGYFIFIYTTRAQPLDAKVGGAGATGESAGTQKFRSVSLFLS